MRIFLCIFAIIVFCCFLRFALFYTVNFHIVSCGQSIRLSIHPSDRVLKAHRTHAHFCLCLARLSLDFLSVTPLKLSSFLTRTTLELENLDASTVSLWLVLHDFARVFSFPSPLLSFLRPHRAPAILKLAVVRITSNVRCVTTFDISSKVTAAD